MAMPTCRHQQRGEVGDATSGRPGVGRPAGMSPTTSIPICRRRKRRPPRPRPACDERPGARGATRSDEQQRPAPTAPGRVGQCISSELGDERADLGDGFVALHGTPVILPSWLAIMMTATPAMYPTSTGLDSRSARKPSRTRGPAGRSRRRSARAPPPMRRTGRRRRRPAAQVRSRSSAPWSTPVRPTAAATSRHRVHGQRCDRCPQPGDRRQAGHLAYAITWGTM